MEPDFKDVCEEHVSLSARIEMGLHLYAAGPGGALQLGHCWAHHLPFALLVG